MKPDEEPIGELAKTIEIYESVDSTLQYPRRYVSFIDTFEKIVAQKKIGITEQQQRIQVNKHFFIHKISFVNQTKFIPLFEK